jgi:ankyrin repeat protein
VKRADQAIAQQAEINAVRHSSNRALSLPCSVEKGSNQSPLSLAALQGNEKMVALLIEKGADLDGPPYCTPLALAVIANKPDIVRVLISKGASDALTTKPYSALIPHTPKVSTNVVILAASMNRSDLIEVFADKGIGLDQPDLHGRTALYVAAEFGHSESIRALAKRGASINYQLPDNGPTALAVAVANQKLEAVRLLLAVGADPNVPYKVYGLTGMRTVTPLAVARQGNPDILKLLEQAGAKD